MNKETFCAYPFNTVFLGSDGGVRPCCSARKNVGNINEQPLEEIINGPIMKSIRTSIVNNTWNPICSQCKELEEVGARTERTGVLDKFEEFIDADENTFKLQKIDIRWSNTCNLSCNYCYEYFSSQWANIKGIKVNANKDLAEESVFSLIEQNIDSIENINLLGGEPLLQKQNKRLIEMLYDKTYYILTNLSVDIKNNEIAQKLINMDTVEWGISFETIGDKFEYVRHGADWNTFNSNLLYLKENNTKMINAHPLYCTYTALNLVEYYDFLLNSGVFTSVFWCAIQNIQGLNVNLMPNDFKEKAIREIESCETQFGSMDSRYSGIDHLTGIKVKLIESLNEKDSKSGIEHFYQWTQDIENKYMKKKFTARELWPELYA